MVLQSRECHLCARYCAIYMILAGMDFTFQGSRMIYKATILTQFSTAISIVRGIKQSPLKYPSIKGFNTW